MQTMHNFDQFLLACRHTPGDEFAAMFDGPVPGRATTAAATVHVSASGQKIEASWVTGSDNQMANIVDTTDDEAAAKARVKVAVVSFIDLN